MWLFLYEVCCIYVRLSNQFAARYVSCSARSLPCSKGLGNYGVPQVAVSANVVGRLSKRFPCRLVNSVSSTTTTVAPSVVVCCFLSDEGDFVSTPSRNK